MYSLLRKILFLLPPETAHHFTLTFAPWFHGPRRAERVRKRWAKHPVELLGLTFSNPVGLAAGLDKDAQCLDAWFAMGFGFVEVGTVTPKPQGGNPKPRLHRLTDVDALINRMGFNNKGVDALVERLKQRRVPGIVGVNIGKNAQTPLERAADDYRHCMMKVYEYADYIVINISSPNTPGLRELQGADYLDHLLLDLMQTRGELQQLSKKHVPLLVKIAPDLSQEELEVMVNIFIKHNIDGVIATNTLLDRSVIENHKHASKQGGLSGKPIFQPSKYIVEQLFRLTKGKLPIIGVGGIHSAQSAQEMLAAGASAIQLYTGLIYEGPRLIQDIIKKIEPQVQVSE